MENRIPKTIHYVWMGGGKKNDLMLKCIESWKKFCPDYEIIEWNETNFDVEGCEFVRRAIESKNWALASDYIRVWALLNYGGIYLDTDAEMLKPIDKFLEHDFFIGYESGYWLNPATFGSVKGHIVLQKLLLRLENVRDITFSTNPLTVHAYGAVLKMLYKLKLNGKSASLADGIEVYPKDVLCPMHYVSGELEITENTYVLHHYTNTWFSKSQKKGANFAKKARRRLGKRIYRFFEHIVAMRFLRMIKKDFKRIEKKDAEIKKTALKG